MTLFLPRAALDARRALLRDPRALGGLAPSLQRELHAALDVPMPEGKSRLTRHGGRCSACTVLLAFDPRSPFAHACPNCGTVYTDSVHHEWWLMNGHLWTAEQCTRAAALAFLCDDAMAAARADRILAAYTERYLQWPNRDNALGPTRPFFSTYLESIWLLHLATALDLRAQAAGGTTPALDAARDRLVAPSAALIASFDEGRSNRQVWHAAALLAAARVLDDGAMRDHAAASLVALLRDGLHTDGSWYEGENYHLFAHRGLLSAVTLAEQSGVALPADLLQRFEDGFAVPFRTMLPDGTFPSRRDSQYGVSLRQYRTADWVECGFARRDTPALHAALAMMYDTTAPEGDTGRALSTADAERNQRGVRLSRADCSWRALLLARPALPPLAGATPQSELLEGQGLAIFRRNAGRLWVGLDYGDPGDGHGHPDRLNLVIATDTHRWLDDVGTGSYTSPTLEWYRSSMAHNAPFVNGASQGEAHGTLLTHDEQGDTGWVSAAFSDPASGVQFTRTVVVTADHVLDELTWTSSADVQVDVPVQAALRTAPADAWAPFTPGTEMDAWLTSPRAVSVNAGQSLDVVVLAPPSPTQPGGAPAATVALATWSSVPAELWSAATIGPPAGAASGVLSLRQRGTSGRSLRAIALDGTAVQLHVHGDTVTVTTRAGGAQHQRMAGGWSVCTAPANPPVSLGGQRPLVTRTPASAPAAAPRIRERIVCTEAGRGRVQATFILARDSYRATEVSWDDAHRPAAEVTVATQLPAADHVTITADVRLSRTPDFAAPVADNPLDNEHPDTNSDGVQLHWRSVRDGAWNSVLAVPEPGGSGCRLSVTGGQDDGCTARYTDTHLGYALTFTLPWPGPDQPLEFELVVNEMPLGRERRRGQLVLGGARGESAYLRGARQGDGRAVTVLFQSPRS